MPMNEDIDIIIAKKLSGEASEDDARILEEWLAADGRNKAEYDKVAQLWNGQEELFNNIHFNTTAAWEKVSAKTTAPPLQTEQKKTVPFPAWGKYLIAAAAILLLGIFILKPAANNSGMQVAIADADNKDVVLPDNSHVTLRKGSKLSYPATFAANERNVSLEGEAFFEVTRNEQKPFVIEAQSVSVKVLGTSFDVKCDGASAKVTVATGKVQMTSAKNKSEFVILTKGEYGTLADNRLTEQLTGDNNYLFWKTGMLQYDNKPLSYIVSELSYYYDKTITIDSSGRAGIKDQLITISFNKQTIDKVMEELCLVAQCKWQQKDNQYVISAK